MGQRETEKRAVETKRKFSVSSTAPTQSDVCNSSSVDRSRLGPSPGQHGDGRSLLGLLSAERPMGETLLCGAHLLEVDRLPGL